MRIFRSMLTLLPICLGVLAAPAAADGGEGAHDRLQRLIDRAIDAAEPFFTPAEHALIERKCGYAAGAWDGRNVNMSDGILTCANGRRVDDPEVRAMMAVAGERISRRVNEVMRSPEIEAAIAAVADEARAEALTEFRERRRVRDALR